MTEPEADGGAPVVPELEVEQPTEDSDEDQR